MKYTIIKLKQNSTLYYAQYHKVTKCSTSKKASFFLFFIVCLFYAFIIDRSLKMLPIQNKKIKKWIYLKWCCSLFSKYTENKAKTRCYRIPWKHWWDLEWCWICWAGPRRWRRWGWPAPAWSWSASVAASGGLALEKYILTELGTRDI